MRAQVNKITRTMLNGAESASKLFKLADQLFKFMTVHNLRDKLPMRTTEGYLLVRDNDNNLVYAEEITDENDNVLFERGEAFTGDPSTLGVANDQVLGGSYQNITIGEAFEIGNFLATITYKVLGNKHPQDSTKTTLGFDPFTETEMNQLRNKYTL